MENITKEKGFTLAEVLITLVIIGVVAAITVPMLMNNTNDKKWNVARQKAQATIGEAFRLATVNGEISDKKSDGTQLTTEDFAKEILPKYLKIAKTCGSDTIAAKECGFPSKVKRAVGLDEVDVLTDWSQATSLYGYIPSTNSFNVDNPTSTYYKTGYYLQTLDGFSLLFFYNPYCAYDENDKKHYYDSSRNQQASIDTVCFNAVYDMNGITGPNTVGKDIGFVGSFYSGYDTKAIATLPFNKEFAANGAPGTEGNNYFARASQYCRNIDNEGNWILADLNELSLIFLNRYLVSDNNTHHFISRTQHVENKDFYFRVLGNGLRISTPYLNDDSWFRCVRNTALK